MTGPAPETALPATSSEPSSRPVSPHCSPAVARRWPCPWRRHRRPCGPISETMRSYLDALLARGDFADYFTDVTWTTIGTGQELQGRQPVRNFLTWMHTQAFDAQPKVKTPVVGDGQAALEADFVGTHTDEFGSFAKAVHERHPSTLAVAGPERADDHAAPSQER